MSICKECDDFYEDDCTDCESEVEVLVKSHSSEITRFLENINAAKRPFEAQQHLYSVIVWDDELMAMKNLFEKLVKAF